SSPVRADAETDEKQAELEQVRRALESLRKTVQRDVVRRDRLTRQLRDVELEVADAAGRLQNIRVERVATEQRRKEIADEQSERREILADQQDALAGQLRSAYVTGREESLKLMLNQQDPAELGRLMVYYGYLNRARTEQISSIAEQLRSLAELDEAERNEAARLERLEAERTEELNKLNKAREEREQLLARVSQEIDKAGVDIERLEAEEASLIELIERLRHALAEFPVQVQTPFVEQKGQLSWPVRGPLLVNYGERRARQLRWTGIVVGADPSTDVRAVAPGRVAYADWLPGLGLLLIIEHGDGYLSLYGHNQSLNKAAGDWVSAGEVVAGVGDSGGHKNSGLYFEIRHGKKPVNPRHWLKRR
ncbi:MAG: peptidoglycan DD-metalloendopeptidase family protein, partial [Gammaproteobacteria bacterium]